MATRKAEQRRWGRLGRMTPEQRLDLADWRRRIAELYSKVRRQDNPEAAWQHWRSERDRLFRSHPQSPLSPARRKAFGGLSYFPYDPALRFAVELRPAEHLVYNVSSREDELFEFSRFATASFELGGRSVVLEVYWLAGYSGGIFLPFKDAAAGSQTYGGGRYLLDTAKGADLGTEDGRLVVDFNFAFQPSCSYDERWACPLAPEANRLALEVPAGETFTR